MQNVCFNFRLNKHLHTFTKYLLQNQISELNQIKKQNCFLESLVSIYIFKLRLK